MGLRPPAKAFANLTNLFMFPLSSRFSSFFHAFYHSFQTCKKLMNFSPFNPIKAPFQSRQPHLFESGFKKKLTLPETQKLKKASTEKSKTAKKRSQVLGSQRMESLASATCPRAPASEDSGGSRPRSGKGGAAGPGCLPSTSSARRGIGQ